MTGNSAPSAPALRRLIAGPVLFFVSAGFGLSQSSGPLSGKPDSIAEVLWKAGDTEISATAVCVKTSPDFFICRRPELTGKAGVRLKDGGGVLEILATDAASGLALLQFTPAENKLPDPATRFAPARLREAANWIRPGNSAELRTAGGKTIEAVIAGRDLIYENEKLPVTLLRLRVDPETEIETSLPLFESKRNRLIGLVIPAGLSRSGEYHAVPAVFISKLLQDFETAGRAASAKMGASFKVGSTTPQIVSVREDSPADEAGIRPGDIVLQIGDRQIRRLSDVIESLRTLSPGKPVEVKILRSLDTEVFSVTPETAEDQGVP